MCCATIYSDLNKPALEVRGAIPVPPELLHKDTSPSQCHRSLGQTAAPSLICLDSHLLFPAKLNTRAVAEDKQEQASR